MSWEVFLTARATKDVDELLTWISQRSKQGAVAWVDRFDQLLNDLRHHPLAFGIAPEGERFQINLRHAIFRTKSGQPYRALFVHCEHRVYVVHVRGPGQDILSLEELQLPI